MEELATISEVGIDIYSILPAKKMVKYIRSDRIYLYSYRKKHVRFFAFALKLILRDKSPYLQLLV